MYPQRIFVPFSFLIVPQILCVSQPEGESKGVCEMTVKKMAVAAGKGATATTPRQVGAANPTEAKL
jgi:hypothetical protein